MSILIFIITLGVLIFVHELGHFIFAKKTGMLVEEFAIGFPPRVFSFTKGETKYSIGLIPIGGFVKILGEEYGEEENEQKDKNYERRFTSRPKWAQAVVLIAGVSFNFLLAWVLISIGFMSGLPVSADQFENEDIGNPELILLDVLSDSPAEEAGLEIGDAVLFLEAGSESVQYSEGTEAVENFIASHGGQELDVLYKRDGETVLTQFIPKEGVIEGKPAVGISFGMVGIIKFNPIKACWEGLKNTVFLTISTVIGLKELVTGGLNLSQISGPVGIVSMVGEAFDFGFVYLLSFISIISINLAVINLIPIPALDGGRLLFVLIEAVKGSPIKAKVANSLNLIGFALLLLFMLVITFSDVSKFF